MKVVDEQGRRYLCERLDMCGQFLAEAADHDASFIRSVRAEYKRIMKILYPEAFPKKSSERRRMTFACLTTGCPAKKTKLIHKAVKTLTLTCQACGHVSKYYLDEQKVVKTEYH